MNPAPLQPAADTDQRQRGARRRELETSKELERELDWLAALVQVRLERLFRGDTTEDPAEDTTGDPANPSPFSPQLPPIPEPPPLLVANASEDASPWAQLAAELADEPLARLALALLLAAQLRPQALDALQVRNPQLERRFSECGGVVRESGLEPTGDTLWPCWPMAARWRAGWRCCGCWRRRGRCGGWGCWRRRRAMRHSRGA